MNPAATPFEILGFRLWEGQPEVMRHAHRQGEIEANLVLNGGMTYLSGGRLIPIPARQWALFWAAVPHELVKREPGTRMGWATIPLNWFLHWPIPEKVRNAILRGRLVIDTHPEAHDVAIFQRMVSDYHRPEPVHRQLLAQEVEVRFCRLILQNPRYLGPAAKRSPGRPRRGSTDQLCKVESIAASIATHYREDLRIQRIARAVGLHPNYAMTLFRRHTGLSLITSLTHQRIWQAQRLLATTDQSVLEVATASGFGSLSRFYEAFTKTCQTTPRAYRTMLQPRTCKPRMARTHA